MQKDGKIKNENKRENNMNKKEIKQKIKKTADQNEIHFPSSSVTSYTELNI